MHVGTRGGPCALTWSRPDSKCCGCHTCSVGSSHRCGSSGAACREMKRSSASTSTRRSSTSSACFSPDSSGRSLRVSRYRSGHRALRLRTRLGSRASQDRARVNDLGDELYQLQLTLYTSSNPTPVGSTRHGATRSTRRSAAGARPMDGSGGRARIGGLPPRPCRELRCGHCRRHRRRVSGSLASVDDTSLEHRTGSRRHHGFRVF